MTAVSAFSYIAGFTVFAVICWALVLVDGPNIVFPKIVWILFLIVCCMSIGNHLALMVALSYELNLNPEPIEWMEEPIKAAGVMLSTLLSGGGFSYGAYSFLKSLKVFTAKSLDPTV